MVSSQSIIGIDMGALYTKIALVRRGSPLSIVTNLHSKRKTETMILFDEGSRFYGSDASSLIARKPLRTAVSFNRMVGRTGVHPGVKEIGDRYFCVAGEDRLYEDFEESKKVDD